MLRAVEILPMTADEFIAARDLNVNSWAPVFSELKREGHIRPMGLRRKTRLGRWASVMERVT